MAVRYFFSRLFCLADVTEKECANASSVPSDVAELFIHFLLLLPSASPPDFTGNVLRALLKAKAGSTVTLECKPQAFPIASILWKKGNLPIHTNDR